jgi:hypothetical protein
MHATTVCRLMAVNHGDKLSTLCSVYNQEAFGLDLSVMKFGSPH